jgi:predicted amidohydrolase YtcJ
MGAATAGATAALGGCAKAVMALQATNERMGPDLILFNGKVATLDRSTPFVEAVAIQGGHILEVGTNAKILSLKGASAKAIDLQKHTVIPGLNDSHLHLIRGGLNYNLELRWDGVPSLADAMRMVKEQAARTPRGQWVRVVGGFGELQFAEKRLPTLQELNDAAPDTPVFILHLYDRALLNRAALQFVGYTKQTPDPPGGIIERDARGEPTGLLVANPNATILYKTLALGPRLSVEQQLNSTRHFMRELNRLGVTSCCDAGGGFQNYPEDYEVITELQRRGELTLRIAYNLFTQKPKAEKEDFARWLASTRLYQGDDYLRLNGAGEMLVYSAADFEDFRVARPDMPREMEAELESVVALLARNRWPFRLHATYDTTIDRALNVFERVHREAPLTELRWFFDHCETISERSIERIKVLGGGIAIQHRMAFQGEYFVQQYGKAAAQRTPPFKRMLDMGIPLSAGTDATRVAGYNPWTSLSWLVTGKTVGGTSLYPEGNLLSRMEALRLFTIGSAWFSREESKKGALVPGQYADFAVLSEDFFECPAERIRGIESVLTTVGGKIVHAVGPFKDLAPAPLPVLPDWSPTAYFASHHRTAHGPNPTPVSVCGLASEGFGTDRLGGPCNCAVF